jgi:hypothetical protein
VGVIHPAKQVYGAPHRATLLEVSCGKSGAKAYQNIGQSRAGRVLLPQHPYQAAHLIGRSEDRIDAVFFHFLVMADYEQAHYFDGPRDYFGRKVHSRIHSASDLLQYGDSAVEHAMLPSQNLDRRPGVLRGLGGL